MKIAVVSDLHHSHWNYCTTRFDELVMVPMLLSIHNEKPDLILDAGDTEHPDFWERFFPDFPARSIPGNHDYYGTTWKTKNRRVHNVTGIEGATVVATPLWTDFNQGDERTKRVVGSCLNDYHWIKNFTPDECLEAHYVQRHFLEDQFGMGRVDVVMTHHCPSFKSIHLQYKAMGEHDSEYLCNYGFASHLDWLVEKSGAKLWVHGHTHIPCRYKIGETLVVCNPCGYPHERLRPYTPVYVEI